MEDAEIVQMYWDRNELAIPATAENYGKYCRAIAGNILGSREDAEECVNDTYLRAWNSIPPSRPGLLSAYLGKITRNLSLDRWRAQRAQKRWQGQAEAALEELIRAAEAGLLPFSLAALTEYLRGYRAAGCPPVSHSAAYRAAYHPAYRVGLRSLLPEELRTCGT